MGTPARDGSELAVLTAVMADVPKGVVMLRPQDSATREGNFSAIESSGFRSLDEGQRVELTPPRARRVCRRRRCAASSF